MECCREPVNTLPIIETSFLCRGDQQAHSWYPKALNVFAGTRKGNLEIARVSESELHFGIPSEAPLKSFEAGLAASRRKVIRAGKILLDNMQISIYKNI